MENSRELRHYALGHAMDARIAISEVDPSHLSDLWDGSSTCLPDTVVPLKLRSARLRGSRAKSGGTRF